jgi:uncharacterized BrkB/YihY/UPF0761 family membrane protein
VAAGAGLGGAAGLDLVERPCVEILRRTLAETAVTPLAGTAVWGLITLAWLTVRVMRRLQQLERQQKQQREEEKIRSASN